MIPLLSKNQLLYDAFWWCETKKFDKIVIPLLSRKFFLPEQFWNTERFAHDVFWRCEAKVFRRKKVTPHFLCIFFFPYYNISETQKSSPTKFFGTARLKIFAGKSSNSPIMHKNFGCRKLTNTLRGSPQNIRHCETKTIDRIVITLLSKKIDTRIFLKHRMVHPRSLLAMWDKKNSKKVWYPYYPKIICYQNIFETQKGSPTTFFGDVKQKNSAKSWYFIIQNFFDNRILPKHKGHPTKFFGTVRQKGSTKSWYLFYLKKFWYENISETQKG